MIAMHLRLPLLLSTAALLAGCTPYVIEWSPDDAPKTLQVDIARHTYAVQFAPGATSLGATEAAKLTRFVAAGGISPEDRIAIMASDPGSKLAERRRDALLRVLHGQGVGASASVAALPKTGQNRVVLEIEHAVVTPPECPNWSKPPIDYSAQVSSNFGCANATNLALMVADPADLLRGNPNALTDPDSASGPVQAFRSQQGYGAPKAPSAFAGDFTNASGTQ